LKGGVLSQSRLHGSRDLKEFVSPLEVSSRTQRKSNVVPVILGPPEIRSVDVEHSQKSRMDRNSSGKSDPPYFKQDQTTLFCCQRRRKRAYCFIPHRNRHSELPAILDRHELTGNRDHLGTMIFFSSE
jgi:hypothetical protein